MAQSLLSRHISARYVAGTTIVCLILLSRHPGEVGSVISLTVVMTSLREVG